MINIHTEMSEEVAMQLAQFCKRSTFDVFYELTEEHLPPDERKRRAYMMIAGIESIQHALADSGIAPR